jgi:hypothetical protein
MKKLSEFIFILLLSASINTTFASVTVLNGLTHMLSGNTGDELRGEVVLLNSTDEEQMVFFDINEALFSCELPRIFTQKNPHSRSSSEWFSGESMSITLAPREKYVYQFSINIPRGQVEDGSYWSMLMVTVENPIRQEDLNNSVGLDTKIRYGIGLLTHVGSFNSVDLGFGSVELSTDSTHTQKALSVQIKNAGAFIEGVAMTLEIYDANGKKIKKITTKRNMVFPGFCKSYDINISELPAGEYQCLLLADSRDDFIGTNLPLILK